MNKLAKADWVPTKAEPYRNGWRASRADGVTSRLAADLQIAEYVAALRLHARGNLLDLGCGNAPFTGVYAPLVDSYLWADWPNSAHQKFELDQHVDLNSSPLPFADASFDTILLTDVLEHISEPDSLLRELKRIMRPGGKLLIGVPFLYPIHEQPNDHHRYTRFQLAYFAHKLGFDVLELREVGGPLDVWTDITCKILGGAWRPLARLPYYSWRALRVLGFVRRLNSRLAWKMPLAYMAVFAQLDDSNPS